MTTRETLCIFLNSQTATSYIGGHTSDCLFDLPGLVISRSSRISVSVQTASIPYSFFNVDDFNDNFNYTVNGVTYLTTIPQGNYNVLTLASALRTIMGVNFTITNNSLNNSFTFVNSLYSFQFLSSSKCFEILGFKNNFTYSSVLQSLTSNISINLFTIRNIYITSNNFIFNNINNSTPNQCNILCSIPIQSSGGSIITYSNIYNILNPVQNVTNMSFLHIKLTDQDGDILDLNGVHFSLTLQLDIETPIV